MACEELMPIRESVCIMILKVTTIVSFVLFVFSLTMMLDVGATPVMMGLLPFITGSFPKLVAIYIDGGRQEKIEAMITDERIPNIVQEYINGTALLNQEQKKSGEDADVVILLNENEKNIELLELLGVELGSVAQEARIAETRLSETIDMLHEWHSRSSCTKRQLQSLIGKLNFICSVCHPGRTFLRRMIDLLQTVQHPSHHIRLGNRFLKDLNWWLLFLRDCNGKSMFYDEQWLTSYCLHLYTDACTRSFGAMFGDSWLCDTFDNVGIPKSRSITFKKLFAITMAITVWATALTSQKIIFHCDDKAVVNVLTSDTSKCRHIVSLIRYLFYICCKFNIVLKAVRIPGIENAPSDALSRLQVARFRDLVPHAKDTPTPVRCLPLDDFK
ncbi:hypothetical protein ACROYT_G028000 [Oculina patagonica]